MSRNRSKCSSCGAAIPDGARYCASCGSPLGIAAGVSCPACHTENPNHAQFCLACGAPLGSVSEADRRIVTVVFADLSGFTELTETMDPEDVRNLVADCLGKLSACVTRWGGFVDKFIGDCVMALFGAPIAYENEEERAVRAALDMHEAMREWSFGPLVSAGEGSGFKPQLRIGINSGPVVTGVFGAGSAQNYTAVGDTVNVASRLQGLCERGEILVGQLTYEQTRHLFEFEDEQVLRVKGRREPVRARYVTGMRAERGKERGFLGKRAPLIGREQELRNLRELWRKAVEGEFQVCLVTGLAGIGKTRLVEELVQAEGIDSDRVARGRSYPYSTSAPWAPVAELLRDLHGISPELPPEEAAARVVRGSPRHWSAEGVAGLKVVLGGSQTDVPELQAYSVAERRDWITGAVSRAMFDGMASPSLLVLEDLHWADSSTLEYLCTLPASEYRGPALVVLITRPPLPGERLVAKLLDSHQNKIELDPLPPDMARGLIESLLEKHQLSDDLLELITERAGGNPLFIEETLKWLVEKGALQKSGDSWQTSGDLAELEIPDSIESVLTTRIDRLDPSVKQVLQFAAVVGRRFWAGVVSDALAERPIDDELQDLLEGAFVRSIPGSILRDDREFQFEHLLLQEAAYEGMLRGARSKLHGAVARWFEAKLGEKASEFAAWIAFHFENSNEPERALPYLAIAAQEARAEGALLDSRNLVERALTVASEPEKRVHFLLLAEDIALAEGDGERRRETIEELETLTGDIEDQQVQAEVAYRRARYELHRGDLQAAGEKGELALSMFEELEDVSLQGDALRLLGRVAHQWGDFPRALRFYRSSLELEQKAGDRYGQAEIFNRLALVQVDIGNFSTGLDYARAARDLFAELNDRPSEASALASEATALRWLGRYDEAEAAARSAVDLAERCGSRNALANAELNLGMVLASSGSTAEAQTLLLSVTDLATVYLGKPGLAARAWLVLAMIQAGDEARASARRAQKLGGDLGLKHIDILARTREAEIDLEDGRLAEADAASSKAVRGLEYHFNIQGAEERVFHTRARVLQALGKEAEASEFAQRAKTIVINKADRIEDPELRRRYLEDVALNQDILSMAPAQ